MQQGHARAFVVASPCFCFYRAVMLLGHIGLAASNLTIEPLVCVVFVLPRIPSLLMSSDFISRNDRSDFLREPRRLQFLQVRINVTRQAKVVAGQSTISEI